MILIDVDGDLNMEDDDGRNFTRFPESADQPRVGSVLVAGRPQFWSWVVIDEVDDDVVYFHQIRPGTPRASRRWWQACLRPAESDCFTLTPSGTSADALRHTSHISS